MYFTYDPTQIEVFWVLMAASALYGILFTAPVGGADMPVVIALLNSASGLAAAATGFVLSNNVLIISGSLVGASGFILTDIMCKAMNRSLFNVLSGDLGAAAPTQGKGADVYQGRVKSASAEEAAMILDAARTVTIVPGYGMAVAQAQHAVRDFADLLQKRGVEVRYAIHPVAGRMPGHMNVLLAEAKVPYDQLFDMDAINPTFRETDVAIVLGANDVVNPAARRRPGKSHLWNAHPRCRQGPDRVRHQAQPQSGLRRHPQRAIRRRQHPDALRGRQRSYARADHGPTRVRNRDEMGASVPPSYAES